MNNPPILLVATDLSRAAQLAEQRALQLASRLGAHVVLLEVLERGALDTLRHWLSAEAPDAGDLARLQRRAEALSGLSGVPVQACQREGEPAAEILAEADRLDARLILCGLRGSHTQDTPLHGSLPPRLARRSSRPLLVVRNTVEDDYPRIQLNCDFSPACAIALHLLQQCWPAAATEVVHVAQAPFENKLAFAGVPPEQLDAYRQDCLAQARLALDAWLAEQAPNLPSRLLGPGYPPELLHRYALNSSAQLLVLGQTLRTPAWDVLFGSVTLHLWERADCDLLLVPG